MLKQVQHARQKHGGFDRLNHRTAAESFISAAFFVAYLTLGIFNDKFKSMNYTLVTCSSEVFLVQYSKGVGHVQNSIFC